MSAQRVSHTVAARAVAETGRLVDEAHAAPAHPIRAAVGPAVVTAWLATPARRWANPEEPMPGPWSTLPGVTGPADVQVLVEFSGN